MNLARGAMLQSRYRIVSPLDRGGMAAVYRAWDTRLNVPLAVKEMTPQPGIGARMLAQLREQFEQEAQTLARLKHPHLVRVSDFFEEGGNAYLVMDFVDGESLAQRISRAGALPEEEVIRWAQQLLDALAYCHAQGVIHRDVKPQNIIIGPDGQVVLVDFGLVKLWDPADPRTKTQMRGMGTPEYAPPEQYDIQMGHTDARSDIYGLGATLYHALAGQAPPTATLRMADPEEFKPLGAVAPRVSEGIADAVTKAMALARSARWQSAGEMADGLGVAISIWEKRAARWAASRPRESTRRIAVDGAAAPSVEAAGTSSAGPIARPISLAAPAWAWGVGVLALLAVITGVALGLTGIGGGPLPTPTAVEDTATAIPAVVDETASATRSPSPRPTESTTPRPTSAPVPRAETPQLISPTQGMWVEGNPVTFQWQGALGEGQAYRVVATHAETQHSENTTTTDTNWDAFLPIDKAGLWVWTVSVVQDGGVFVTSDAADFRFDPGFSG